MLCGAVLRSKPTALRVTIRDNSTVVLEGKVDNWDERHAVESAAWSAPGVTSVDDRLFTW